MRLSISKSAAVVVVVGVGFLASTRVPSALDAATEARGTDPAPRLAGAEAPASTPPSPLGRDVIDRDELIDALAEEAGLDRADAERAVDALFGVPSGIIAGALKEGDSVQIAGFGSFETRKRKARRGRNPRTGETIKIPAAITPNFRAAADLKEAVQLN